MHCPKDEIDGGRCDSVPRDPAECCYVRLPKKEEMVATVRCVVIVLPRCGKACGRPNLYITVSAHPDRESLPFAMLSSESKTFGEKLTRRARRKLRGK